MANEVIEQNDGIPGLLENSELVSPTDSSLAWHNLKIERRVVKAGAKEPLFLAQHFLILWEKAPALGEIEERPGLFMPYKKLPGMITSLLPGIRPAIRNQSDYQVLACSIPARFLHDLELEMDKRPTGSFRPLYGNEDAVLRQLMLSLIRGAAIDGDRSSLRMESIFTELADRLLFVSRSVPQPTTKPTQRLPKHLLRRVLERMHDELDSDLSLSTLAAESGYSRAQSMRLFKAASGQTPHKYLLELRLRRAQEMITVRSKQIIDIALECGFRSHAHFSVAFNQRFGIAPSLYRKSLFQN
jgi:AraC family transcriptional regulator